MKIIRLKLSKAKPAPRRWIASALRTAETLDTTLTNRRATPRPQALYRPLSARLRHARTA